MNNLFKKIWHSPTFTTWGNYAAKSLRLLLVTPLILTRFDTTEIAAWYLFASLNFFGETIATRLGLTFSRMFAFAMGGASNLSPIKGKRERENDGKPNWNAFERAYGTIGSLNLGIGWFNILIALGMGWFGLNNILSGYEAKGTIWLAFAFMQVSSLLVFIFQRYQIALRGMNYIALSNRWAILFSLLSILFGFITLWCGGGIVALVIVMQLFAMIGVLRNRFLLHNVEEGRVIHFKQYGFDREVFRWAWEPTWKGFIAQFGLSGSAQLTAVIYTAFGSKIEVAALLFAVRMLQTITQIAQAPFSAVQPLMSRMMAAGEMKALGRMIKKRMALVMSLMLVGVLAGALVFPFLLQLIGSNLVFIPVSAWLLLGGFTLIIRFNVLCCAVRATGNEMIYYWEMGLAAICSAVALILLGNLWGVYTPIVTSTLPLIIILNFGPARKARIVLMK